ncbi:MAG: hypothetical protein AAGF04_00520 [Chlamydiota bacterium]
MLPLPLFAEEAASCLYSCSACRVGYEEDFRVILQPEFLFLRAEEGLLEYAIEPTGAIALVRQTAFIPSFRINLGVQTDYDFHDFLLSYTRYHSKKKAEVHSETDSILPLLWFLDPMQAALLRVSWRLDLDAVDLWLKKRVFLGSCCRVGWGYGLRGGVVRQKIYLSSITESSAVEKQSQNQSDSWCVGPKLWMAGDCFWSEHAYCLFETALCLLYNHYHLEHTETSASSRNETMGEISNAREITFGIGYSRSWSTEFHCDLSARAYYFSFPGENRLPGLLVPGSGKGDLSLIGVGLSTRFDF